jgi:hypothetical protein
MCSFRRDTLACLFAVTFAFAGSAAAQDAWGKAPVTKGWNDAETSKKADAPAAAKKPAAAPAKTPVTATKAPKPAPTAPSAEAKTPATAPVAEAARVEPAPAKESADAKAATATPAAPAAGTSSTGVLVPPAPQRPAAPVATAAPAVKPASIAVTKRWFDLQTATAAVRYRYIETSAGVVAANQMQMRQVAKARVKLDQGGAYTVNLGLASGSSLTGGWNATGVGSGQLVTNVYVKQFYFGAVPAKGVELQYGGLSVVRGENTEITSYDDDVYLVGERASIKRPKQWFFDEVSLTQAYLGDKTTPGFFNRIHRLDESNYHQVLFGKKIGKQLAASADYTDAIGVGTVRAGLTFKRAMVVVDTVKFEQYHRLGDTAATGFAIFGEKAFGKRATFGTGWASIDPAIGSLNGDRYARGRRLFATGTLNLSPEFSVSGFFTRAMANDYAIANATRFDLIFTYNVLKTLQRTGLF